MDARIIASTAENGIACKSAQLPSQICSYGANLDRGSMGRKEFASSNPCASMLTSHEREPLHMHLAGAVAGERAGLDTDHSQHSAAVQPALHAYSSETVRAVLQRNMRASSAEMR